MREQKDRDAEDQDARRQLRAMTEERRRLLLDRALGSLGVEGNELSPEGQELVLQYARGPSRITKAEFDERAAVPSRAATDTGK